MEDEELVIKPVLDPAMIPLPAESPPPLSPPPLSPPPLSPPPLSPPPLSPPPLSPAPLGDLDAVEIDRHSYDNILKCMDELSRYLRLCNSGVANGTPSRMSRPMQRKLTTLLQCVPVAPDIQDEVDDRLKTARAARSLGDRAVTELILQHQNPQQLSAHLWAAVRARGCQFLGPAMQEEVLRLVLLALEDGSALSRKVLVMFVVQRLEPHFPQASKTSIGHVVQLLYRASCFKVVKRDRDSSLMQLKAEFRSYETLRREHDVQIVQVAAEAGLRIAPDQWSALLYGDTVHRSHMQSVIDKLQSPQSVARAARELLAALNRTGDPANLLPTLDKPLNRLAHMDSRPDAKTPSWQTLADIMMAVKEVVAGLVQFLHRQPGHRNLPAIDLPLDESPDEPLQQPDPEPHGDAAGHANDDLKPHEPNMLEGADEDQNSPLASLSELLANMPILELQSDGAHACHEPVWPVGAHTLSGPLMPDSAHALPRPVLPDGAHTLPRPVLPDGAHTLPKPVLPDGAHTQPRPVLSDGVHTLPRPVLPDSAHTVPRPVLPDSALSLPDGAHALPGLVLRDGVHALPGSLLPDGVHTQPRPVVSDSAHALPGLVLPDSAHSLSGPEMPDGTQPLPGSVLQDGALNLQGPLLPGGPPGYLIPRGAVPVGLPFYPIPAVHALHTYRNEHGHTMFASGERLDVMNMQTATTVASCRCPYPVALQHSMPPMPIVARLYQPPGPQMFQFQNVPWSAGPVSVPTDLQPGPAWFPADRRNSATAGYAYDDIPEAQQNYADYPGSNIDFTNNHTNFPNEHNNFSNNLTNFPNNHNFPNNYANLPSNHTNFPNSHNNFLNAHSNYSNNQTNFPTNHSNYPNNHMDFSNNQTTFPNHPTINPNHHIDFPSNNTNFPSNHINFPNHHIEFPNNHTNYSNHHNYSPNNHTNFPNNHASFPSSHASFPSSHTSFSNNHPNNLSYYPNNGSNVSSGNRMCDPRFEGEIILENGEIMRTNRNEMSRYHPEVENPAEDNRAVGSYRQGCAHRRSEDEELEEELVALEHYLTLEYKLED